MAEEQVFFSCGDIKLEGLLEVAPGGRGVVVSHPHPLYGGNMYNMVVESITRAYKQAGYTTLRFNFRGTGGSGGDFDQGLGEREDVQAALRFLSGEGHPVIDLAGYSFGVWVNGLSNLGAEDYHRMIMVSPPVAFLDFSDMKPTPQLKLVIGGSRDEIAPVDLIKTMLPGWNPEARLEVIEGADHFYIGHTDRLTSVIVDFLNPNIS
jgi:alpha/beta superfamily hydrolase